MNTINSDVLYKLLHDFRNAPLSETNAIFERLQEEIARLVQVKAPVPDLEYREIMAAISGLKRREKNAVDAFLKRNNRAALAVYRRVRQ
jgi:hypothetical protein